jgi:transposase InsO family protein
MQQESLTCRRKSRFVHTTDSKHSEPVYANLIKDLSVEALNQCWVADLSYVRLPEGFVYLACLLDAYSRKCIGWSLSRSLDSSLPFQALEMALQVREARSRSDPPLRSWSAILQPDVRETAQDASGPGSVCLHQDKPPRMRERKVSLKR